MNTETFKDDECSEYIDKDATFDGLFKVLDHYNDKVKIMAKKNKRKGVTPCY